jgi:DNA modification methylase
MILPEVIRALEHERLAWRWQIAWRFENYSPAQIFRRSVWQKFKPVLVYTAGALPTRPRWFPDEITSSAPDKDHHIHGQSFDGFERLIQLFSEPGDTICDPFCGSGTTAVAAIANGRRFTGCDIDADAVEITRRRLEGAR